jgi:signal transduction histidine kinase
MNAPTIRILIGGFGLIWGLVSEALYHRGGTPAYEVLLDLTIGWTYLYGGLALWASRPANRIGRLMVLVGLTWFIGNLAISDVPVLREAGTLFSGVAATALIALILAYPSGRLETRLDRATVAILAVGFATNSAVSLLPIAQEPNVALAQLWVNVALASFAGIVVIRRWVVAPRRRRPELLPVLIAGSIQMAVLIIFLVIQYTAVSGSVAEFLNSAKTLAPAAIPISLLVGFYRQSELRHRALVDAMPDMTIRLTHDGHVLDIRAEDSVLRIGAVDAMIGRRLHDVVPAGIADAVLSGAAAAIETGELQTRDATFDLSDGQRAFETRISPSGADEVTAIVRDFTDQRAAQAELRQSRARIVEATDAERRRLERDLHDGAQQRLVSLSLALRLARSKLSGDANAAAVAGLDDAAIELKTALVELRELARGIHPAILT